jgi:hypothetical protein
MPKFAENHSSQAKLTVQVQRLLAPSFNLCLLNSSEQIRLD